MSAVGEQAVLEQAVVEVPFDLFRGVLTKGANGGGTVQWDQPGLGVGDYSGKLPKVRVKPCGDKRSFEARIIQEQSVVWLSSSEIGLVNEFPS
jgi:hypothetical protein